MKVALAQINPVIGAFAYNTQKIIQAIEKAKRQRAHLVVFPEMAICGYPPDDLLLIPGFISAAAAALEEILPHTKGISALVGSVRPNVSGGEKGLYNTAAICEDGKLLGFQDKMLLPEYDVFSEGRYFEPAGKNQVWNLCGKKVGVTICEDIWQHSRSVQHTNYSRDPVEELKSEAPDFLVNLSASPFHSDRLHTRIEVCRAAARTLKCPLLFCNQVGGNDSLIFDGYSLCLNSQGEVIALGKGFEEDLVCVDLTQKQEVTTSLFDPTHELYQAIVLGLKDYFSKQGFQKACFGLSGGIDSAVVACLAKEALGKEHVLALLLPSRFTSAESMEDARALAKNLGIQSQELSIEGPFESYLETLAPSFKGKEPDVTEENLQARIRGMLLMAFSNKFGYLVLGTGNKSEMAMGYATLYGDMCGGLGVISDVTKQQVYKLAEWMNQKKQIIPQRILTKPPSAELRVNQFDTDSLPDYDIVDQVLQDYVETHLSAEEIAQKRGIDLSLVKILVRKIHLNEYKRRQAPPTLRVTKKAFSIGRRFPIVQKWNLEGLS